MYRTLLGAMASMQVCLRVDARRISLLRPSLRVRSGGISLQKAFFSASRGSKDHWLRGVDGLETVTMILQSAPYGDERIWNAFRLARALTTAVIGMQVNIFLTGDGVTTAKQGQKPPASYYNLETMLRDLIGQGVQVVACRTCIAARGLTQPELIEGAQIGTTVGHLAKWVKESQKILSY
jgi:uncharacterized protein involved in oxidation of intracellular sulfur